MKLPLIRKKTEHNHHICQCRKCKQKRVECEADSLEQTFNDLRAVRGIERKTMSASMEDLMKRLGEKKKPVKKAANH